MQPVGGENSEIGQDADADLFAHGLFDGGEIVAGEGNVGIFADLFGKPAGKRVFTAICTKRQSSRRMVFR